MKKKVALTITSIALVAALAIGGTLAWLTNQTGPVTNTFTASAGITLDLFEHNYIKETNALGAEEVKNNDNYVIVPGDTNPKDPTLRVGGEESWIFAEIVNGLEDKAVFNNMNGWSVIPGAVGKNGGEVYAYETTVKDDDVTIFDSITYQDMNNEELAALTGKTIAVYGYGVQKSAGDNAAAAWDTSFGNAEKVTQ